LLRTINDNEGEKCTSAIIFCNRKMDVDVVAKSLKKYGYNASPIHGDLEQSQRMKTLDSFREGSLRFLVASDVAARGLDVPNVSHVFNFDVPSHAEDYVHRIGRTGRAGREGTAMMICVPKDEKNLADIERLVQNEIPRLENPLKSAKTESVTVTVTDEAKDSSSGEKKYSGRSRRSSKSSEPRATASSEPVTPVAAATETQAKPDERQSKTDDRRAKSNDSNRARSGDNKSSSRSTNQRSRGGRDNGRTVIGLGDHLPSFIALSFEERRAI